MTYNCKNNFGASEKLPSKYQVLDFDKLFIPSTVPKIRILSSELIPLSKIKKFPYSG